ncbi:MAG: type II toxin-antitoxin system Phd/YefM family antitoxin [Clostridia bacterium]|nr:type II toxin-antitoxin system Phd/YefM family antitoxin [Clostridia bacterium]MDH7572213.1 type II toxin-antitoxin system Phd/YefM family antitoxin [Clostridia bacterium]
MLSPIEVRDRLGQIIEEAYYTGKEFIIARRGRPMAAIVPVSEYEKWEREREEFFKLVEKVWEANRQVDPEEVTRDVAEAVREVRKCGQTQGGV